MDKTCKSLQIHSFYKGHLLNHRYKRFRDKTFKNNSTKKVSKGGGGRFSKLLSRLKIFQLHAQTLWENGLDWSRKYLQEIDWTLFIQSQIYFIGVPVMRIHYTVKENYDRTGSSSLILRILDGYNKHEIFCSTGEIFLNTGTSGRNVIQTWQEHRISTPRPGGGPGKNT